jgi:hypothetical protein
MKKCPHCNCMIDDEQDYCSYCSEEMNINEDDIDRHIDGYQKKLEGEFF